MAFKEEKDAQLNTGYFNNSYNFLSFPLRGDDVHFRKIIIKSQKGGFK